MRAAAEEVPAWTTLRCRSSSGGGLGAKQRQHGGDASTGDRRAGAVDGDGGQECSRAAASPGCVCVKNAAAVGMRAVEGVFWRCLSFGRRSGLGQGAKLSARGPLNHSLQGLRHGRPTRVSILHQTGRTGEC